MFDAYKFRVGHENSDDDIREFLRDKKLLNSRLEEVARVAIATAKKALRAEDRSQEDTDVIVLLGHMQQNVTRLPASEYLQEKGLAEGHDLGMENLRAWYDRNLELSSMHDDDVASTTSCTTAERSGSKSGDGSKPDMEDSWILVKVDGSGSEGSA
jgi:hypothetical protein